MKILHTSDLHFGKRWGGISLINDQNRVLDEILTLCELHDVDMLLVAGDVFSDRIEGNRLADIAQTLLTRLRPLLERGRIIFLLRGNHDSIDLFDLLSFLLTEVSGKDSLPLVVASRPGIYKLPGCDTEVIAVPYVRPSWLKAQPTTLDSSPEEQLADLTGLYSLYVQRLCASISTGILSIFAAHTLIDHAELKPDTEVEQGYVRELVLHASDLPQFTSYNALGHIHLGQEVRGTGKPTWYSGAPDRLDLGERDYHPQVLLVTTPHAPGGTATVQAIGMTSCTAWIVADLRGEVSVDRFCLEVEGHNPIGQVTITDVSPARRLAIESQLRVSLPRMVIRWPTDALGESELIIDGPNLGDVHGTVRAYLDATFAHDTARHDRLVSAFEAVWSHWEEVPA
jgi:exonuclease SbcD